MAEEINISITALVGLSWIELDWSDLYTKIDLRFILDTTRSCLCLLGTYLT